MKREHDADGDREIRHFKQQMIAAHPEDAEHIEKIFSNEDDNLATPLSYEEMEEMERLSVDQITEALTVMQDLGYAVQDY